MSSARARSPNLRAMASGFRFDRGEVARLASARHAEYMSARPFEHIVLDDFLPEAVLDAVLEEFPRADADAWITYESDNERKLASRGETPVGETTHRLLAELN